MENISLWIRLTLRVNETYYPPDAEFWKKEIRIGWFSNLMSDTISYRENVVNAGSYRLRAVTPFAV